MDRSRRRGGISPHFRNGGMEDHASSPKGAAQSWMGALRWCCLGAVILAGVIIALQMDMGATSSDVIVIEVRFSVRTPDNVEITPMLPSLCRIVPLFENPP